MDASSASRFSKNSLEHLPGHFHISDQFGFFFWALRRVGGLWMKSRHPRFVAMTAGLPFGVEGYFWQSFFCRAQIMVALSGLWGHRGIGWEWGTSFPIPF